MKCVNCKNANMTRGHKYVICDKRPDRLYQARLDRNCNHYEKLKEDIKK